MRGLYILPILGALLGGLEFLSTMAQASSAPQQAAGAAMAVAAAVLPYVLVRAMVEMTERPAQEPPKPKRPRIQPMPGSTPEAPPPPPPAE